MFSCQEHFWASKMCKYPTVAAQLHRGWLSHGVFLSTEYLLHMQSAFGSRRMWSTSSIFVCRYLRFYSQPGTRCALYMKTLNGKFSYPFPWPWLYVTILLNIIAHFLHQFIDLLLIFLFLAVFPRSAVLFFF
jgi:hypothetical protein